MHGGPSDRMSVSPRGMFKSYKHTTCEKQSKVYTIFRFTVVPKHAKMNSENEFSNLRTSLAFKLPLI